MAEDAVEKVLEIKVRYDDAIRKIAEYRKQLDVLKQVEKTLTEDVKKGRISRDAYNIKLTETKIASQEYTEAIRVLNKEIQNNRKIEQEQEGSLKQLRAQLSNLTAEYDSLSEAERNAAKGQELKNSINNITDSLKGAEEETQRFYRSVGSYEEAIKNAVSSNVPFIGQLMLRNGAETYRVDDTIKRICSSRGFTHINIFMAPNTIIVSDDRFDGYTFMKVIEGRSINLNKIDLLNDFSRKFVSQTDMSIEDAIEELENLEEKSPHTQNAINIWTAIGSSSFAVLVGGDNALTFMLTLITSVMAMTTYNEVKKISNIPVFATLVSSIIIGLCGVGLVEIKILDTPKMLIVGSIMPLLPGVPFIKAIRDLVSGELMSGVGRAIDAGIIATAIAVGVGIAMNIYVRFGGVL